MYEAAILAIYPIVVFVCALVAWGYGATIWKQWPDINAVFKMRLGIALGFAVTGVRAVIWGTQRLTAFAGFEDAAAVLNEVGLSIAIVPRLVLIVAGLLHMEAVWEMAGKSRWKAVSAIMFIFYIILWFTLTALEP